MDLTFSTSGVLSNANDVVIIGWLALIVAPFNKLSKYIVLGIVLFLSGIYTILLMKSTIPSFDFFRLLELLIWREDPFTHFGVIDLWLGQWMVNDFYSTYTFAYSITMDSNGVYQVKRSLTAGRMIFTLLLLLTYAIAPVGFLFYQLATLTFLQTHKANDRIDFQNDQTFNIKSNLTEIQTESSNRRPVRFGDKLPEPLQKIYHFTLGMIGLIVLFTAALPAYILLRIYCRIKYRAPPNLSTADASLKPNKFIPDCVRNETARMKLASLTTPLEQRKAIWYLKFLLLQLSTFVEYISNATNPIALFTALSDYFQSMYNVRYFVFGDGIGVNSYELVKRYLQDLPPRKGFESLGWQVSSSQATFCDFTTIFLSSDHPDMELGRKIVFQWLHAFPYHLHDNNPETRLYLAQLVPRQIDQKPDEDTVYQAIGEVMFFLATGGELRKHEREAFIGCVKNPFIFFPSWFNFLVVGHYLERKTLNSYYTLLQAFSRYADRPALSAAFQAAGSQKSQLEVLRLIAIVFSIAGSAAPAKLAFAVIERLWSEKEKNVRLFKKNPQNFIKECARLDKVVLMVNVLATKEIADEIEDDFRTTNHPITIPKDTPIHCSLVNANRDKNIFQNPDEFNPDRPDLNKIIVWNGVEEDIMNEDRSKRPIRYCPGHDLSLAVIQYVAEQLSPVIIEENEPVDFEKIVTEDLGRPAKPTNARNSSTEVEQKLILMGLHIPKSLEKDRSCYDVLDLYTRLIMKLMQAAVNESNTLPARGSDIFQPFKTPAKNLDIIRLDIAKFIPTWDEDDPKGSTLFRKFARWLVNQNIWDFHDCLIEFNTIEQAIQWRTKVFSALPIPNIVYTDLTSDQAMTRLAFTGCACHHTHRLGEDWRPGYGIPDEQFLKNAVYVNDMTGLSTFRVRKPFERYGAAAYFDKDYQIIAIYWSHRSRLVKKGAQCWEHAKYVWRSTFFAYVTICDHLVVAHMIEGNAFVTASRKCLPTNHPLRKFVKPFTYHTVSINYQAAKSLINERGLVHRIWAFDYDEFLKVCDYISMNYKFRILPMMISKSMTPEENGKKPDEWEKIYPIYHDVTELWNVIENYVTEFFRINYHIPTGSDSLPNDVPIRGFINEICKQLGIAGITSLQHFIDVLSQLIAASTGIHEHVGQVSGYMTDPRFIGAKLQDGKEIQNVQTYTQILILTVLTGLRMPGLLEDWSHLIDRDQDYAKNLKNYIKFKKDLQNLSEDIDRRNEKRNYPFQSFNPKYMECSTSV